MVCLIITLELLITAQFYSIAELLRKMISQMNIKMYIYLKYLISIFDLFRFMRKLLTFFILISISCILYGQDTPSDIEYPDLGLKGTVTWIDSTHIIVEYDWSDDSQLLDWEMTQGSVLVRENGSVTISGGDAVVRAMIWKQGIKCKRISVKDAAPLSTAGHLNFYCNLTSFTGAVYRPNPGLGAILATDKNFWSHDGEKSGDIGAPFIEVGVTRE